LDRITNFEVFACIFLSPARQSITMQKNGIILLAFYIAAISSVSAEDALESELSGQPAPSSIWVTEVGSGFRKDTLNAGIAVGTGSGAKIFGSLERHYLALAYGHLGWIATDVLGDGKWYKGNLEIWGEVFAGAQYHPGVHYLAGIVFGPRYHFSIDSRWVPFIDAGAGLAATSIGEPDLNTIFEFNLQIGIGAQYFLQEDLALHMLFRGIHLSNAGIKGPNRGVNSFLFMGGLSWFF